MVQTFLRGCFFGFQLKKIENYSFFGTLLLIHKIVSLFSILFNIIFNFTNICALPSYPSDQNATYDICFGSFDWTSGDNKGDKYIGEWKKDLQHGQGMYI